MCCYSSLVLFYSVVVMSWTVILRCVVLLTILTFVYSGYAQTSVGIDRSQTNQHLKYQQGKPLSNSEILSNFDENDLDDVIPFWFGGTIYFTPDEEATIIEYGERFVSTSNDPVLDSIALFLVVEDSGSLTGQVRLRVMPMDHSNGYPYPNYSNVISTVYIDAAALIWGDVNALVLPVDNGRLGVSDFAVMVDQYTLSSRIGILGNANFEDAREIDADLDRAYALCELVEDTTQQYIVAYAGLVTFDDEYYYPELLITCYVHEFDGTTQGTEEWEFSIAGSGSEKVNEVIATGDGGYLLAGYSNSSGSEFADAHGGDDFMIAKFSKYGKKEWFRLYGGTQQDRAFDVVETTSGYLVVGSSTSTDQQVGPHKGTSAAWVLWLDTKGELTQSKAYGATGDGIEAYSIIRNGPNYLIAGKSGVNSNQALNEYSHGEGGVWVMNMSANGDTLWTKNIGGSEATTAKHAGSLAVLPSGKIVIGAKWLANGFPENGAAFILLKDNGSLDHIYRTMHSSQGSVLATDTGFVALSGDSLLVFSPDGTFSQIVRVTGIAQGGRIVTGASLGFAITGFSSQVGDVEPSPSIFALDMNGVITGVRLFDGNEPIQAIAFANHHYFAARSTSSIASDAMLERTTMPFVLDPNLVPVSPIHACLGDVIPIELVASSGFFPFEVEWLDDMGEPLSPEEVLSESVEAEEFRLSLIASSSRTIQLKVTDGAGRHHVQQIVIQLGIDSIPAITQVSGELICSIDDAIYQWLREDAAPIVGETNRSYFPSTSGHFAVRVSKNGCTETSELYTFTSSAVSAAIHQVPQCIYGTQGILTIDLRNVVERKFDFQIVNILGDVLRSETIESSEGQRQIDLSSYAEGVYFAHLISGSRVYTTRILK